MSLQTYQVHADADAAVVVARQQGWAEARATALLSGGWAVQLADGLYLHDDGEAGP